MLINTKHTTSSQFLKSILFVTSDGIYIHVYTYGLSHTNIMATELNAILVYSEQIGTSRDEAVTDNIHLYSPKAYRI